MKHLAPQGAVDMLHHGSNATRNAPQNGGHGKGSMATCNAPLSLFCHLQSPNSNLQTARLLTTTALSFAGFCAKMIHSLFFSF